MQQAVIETNFSDLKLIKRGKVRDIYDLGDTLLMVMTDRISAFDVIMPNPIPGKGKILTQISLFWFEQLSSLVENHVISANVDEYPDACHPYADTLRDRSMLVKKAEPLPIECVVRGYISGSGWKSYTASGTVCGIQLPPGLQESEREFQKGSLAAAVRADNRNDMLSWHIERDILQDGNIVIGEGHIAKSQRTRRGIHS